MTDQTIADDMLTGAAEIGAYIGVTERRAQYLLEGGVLPAFREGRIYRMRKSTYLRHVERLEARAMEGV